MDTQEEDMSSKGVLARLPVNFEDGLVLRMGTPADEEKLVEFACRVFDESLRDDTRMLASGDYPTGRAEWTVVEDAESERLASIACLISQTWSYGGVAFGVGRPEIVATDPEYRRRGFVRRQFEVLHEVSAARGQMMQGITGIPWFYRQLGYEMAMNLGGARTVRLPPVEDSTAHEVHLRPAKGAEDCASIRQAYDRAIPGEVFAGVRSEQEYKWLLKDCAEESESDFGGWSIVELRGRQIDCVRHRRPSKGKLRVMLLQLTADVSPLEILPPLLGQLARYARGRADKDIDARFPDHTFLQLLCGRRRFDELRFAFPDCGGKHESGVLLDCLFPRFSGQIWFL